ncbi:TetR/AcrR family transcriptional regulator [Roseivirga pacifica]|uniref:TetR/AcrR family transcriptional regulator n=1 Tax=Roseivirga pacifica TaxID=1267423 RepID=UPI003BB11101
MEEKLAEKKKMVMESALKLIYEHGFHGCPMSMVAKNAGVAAGTIYTYFESKDELINGLYYYVKNSLFQVALNADNDQKDFKERYHNFWNALDKHYMDHPEIHKFFEQFRSSPYNTAEKQLEQDDWHDWLHSFVQQGIDQGYLKDIATDLHVIMIMGSLSSLTLVRTSFQHKINQRAVDLNKLADMVWDAIKK